MKVLREIWWQIKTFIEGMIVVLTYEDDPELWDNPRKRERIRRRAWRERRRHGKKADV